MSCPLSNGQEKENKMTNPADKLHAQNLSATEANGVQCQLDGVWVHSIPAYLSREWPLTTLEEYQAKYPDAPLKRAAQIASTAKKSEALKMTASAQVVSLRQFSNQDDENNVGAPQKKTFAETFGLGDAVGAKNARGGDIMISVLEQSAPAMAQFVPDVDDGYIYNIDVLKAVMMGFAMNTPVYVWGMHGTGKTTILEQFCARTNRPMIRVQHTATTEESHVLGQYVLKSGETVFEPGPLALAMKYGMTYLADEYDFAMPNVSAVYQPVLEGKALVIKEAPPEWRVIRPHPEFRFAATGNTNGSGDETGLYQGTQIQNAANYSRFGITIQINYMPEKQEIAVIASKASINVADAERLVQVGTRVREAFARSELGCTISPRELIAAAKIAAALGGKWMPGLELAFTNRLSTVDRQAVMDMAQRLLPAD